jgi:hypothetical protein
VEAVKRENKGQVKLGNIVDDSLSSIIKYPSKVEVLLPTLATEIAI